MEESLSGTLAIDLGNTNTVVAFQDQEDIIIFDENNLIILLQFNLKLYLKYSISTYNSKIYNLH